jgi:hypothetical protein
MFLKDKTGAACKNKVSLILTGKAKKKIVLFVYNKNYY